MTYGLIAVNIFLHNKSLFLNMLFCPQKWVKLKNARVYLCFHKCIITSYTYVQKRLKYNYKLYNMIKNIIMSKIT